MSGSEILLILFVALLFFGAKSIPEIARTVGKAVRELNKATSEIKKEFNESTSGISKDILDTGKKIEKDVSKILDDSDPLNNKKA